MRQSCSCIYHDGTRVVGLQSVNMYQAQFAELQSVHGTRIFSEDKSALKKHAFSPSPPHDTQVPFAASLSLHSAPPTHGPASRIVVQQGSPSSPGQEALPVPGHAGPAHGGPLPFGAHRGGLSAVARRPASQMGPLLPSRDAAQRSQQVW